MLGSAPDVPAVAHHYLEKALVLRLPAMARSSSHNPTRTAAIWMPEPAVQPQVISGQQEAVPGQPAPACSPPSLHQAAGSEMEPAGGAIPPG